MAAWVVFSTIALLVEGSSAVPAAVSLGVLAEGMSVEGVSVEGVSVGGGPGAGVSVEDVTVEDVSVEGVSVEDVSVEDVSVAVLAGGVPAGGVSVGGVLARAVSVEGASRVSVLSVAVSLPEDFMSRCVRRYLNFLRDLLVLLCAPCIAKYDRLGPLLTELRRTLDPSAGVSSSAGIDLRLQGGVVSGISFIKITGQESRLISLFIST